MEFIEQFIMFEDYSMLGLHGAQPMKIYNEFIKFLENQQILNIMKSVLGNDILILLNRFKKVMEKYKSTNMDLCAGKQKDFDIYKIKLVDLLRDPTEPFKMFYVGFKEHAASCSVIYKNDQTADIVFQNSGIGSNFHGQSENEIIGLSPFYTGLYFDNVPLNNIADFLLFYNYFSLKLNLTIEEQYNAIFKILLSELKSGQVLSNVSNFNAKKSYCYPIQITGDCSFKAFFLALYTYLRLNANVDVTNYFKIYQFIRFILIENNLKRPQFTSVIDEFTKSVLFEKIKFFKKYFPSYEKRINNALDTIFNSYLSNKPYKGNNPNIIGYNPDLIKIKIQNKSSEVDMDIMYSEDLDMHENNVKKFSNLVQTMNTNGDNNMNLAENFIDYFCDLQDIYSLRSIPNLHKIYLAQFKIISNYFINNTYILNNYSENKILYKIGILILKAFENLGEPYITICIYSVPFLYMYHRALNTFFKNQGINIDNLKTPGVAKTFFRELASNWPANSLEELKYYEKIDILTEKIEFFPINGFSYYNYCKLIADNFLIPKTTSIKFDLLKYYLSNCEKPNKNLLEHLNFSKNIFLETYVLIDMPLSVFLDNSRIKINKHMNDNFLICNIFKILVTYIASYNLETTNILNVTNKLKIKLDKIFSLSIPKKISQFKTPNLSIKIQNNITIQNNDFIFFKIDQSLDEFLEIFTSANPILKKITIPFIYSLHKKDVETPIQVQDITNINAIHFKLDYDNTNISLLNDYIKKINRVEILNTFKKRFPNFSTYDFINVVFVLSYILEDDLWDELNNHIYLDIWNEVQIFRENQLKIFQKKLAEYKLNNDDIYQTQIIKYYELNEQQLELSIIDNLLLHYYIKQNNRTYVNLIANRTYLENYSLLDQVKFYKSFNQQNKFSNNNDKFEDLTTDFNELKFNYKLRYTKFNKEKNYYSYTEQRIERELCVLFAIQSIQEMNMRIALETGYFEISNISYLPQFEMVLETKKNWGKTLSEKNDLPIYLNKELSVVFLPVKYSPRVELKYLAYGYLGDGYVKDTFKLIRKESVHNSKINWSIRCHCYYPIVTYSTLIHQQLEWSPDTKSGLNIGKNADIELSYNPNNNLIFILPNYKHNNPRYLVEPDDYYFIPVNSTSIVPIQTLNSFFIYFTNLKNVAYFYSSNKKQIIAFVNNYKQRFLLNVETGEFYFENYKIINQNFSPENQILYQFANYSKNIFIVEKDNSYSVLIFNLYHKHIFSGIYIDQLKNEYIDYVVKPGQFSLFEQIMDNILEYNKEFYYTIAIHPNKLFIDSIDIKSLLVYALYCIIFTKTDTLKNIYQVLVNYNRNNLHSDLFNNFFKTLKEISTKNSMITFIMELLNNNSSNLYYLLSIYKIDNLPNQFKGENIKMQNLILKMPSVKALNKQIKFNNILNMWLIQCHKNKFTNFEKAIKFKNNGNLIKAVIYLNTVLGLNSNNDVLNISFKKIVLDAISLHDVFINLPYYDTAQLQYWKTININDFLATIEVRFENDKLDQIFKTNPLEKKALIIMLSILETLEPHYMNVYDDEIQKYPVFNRNLLIPISNQIQLKNYELDYRLDKNLIVSKMNLFHKYSMSNNSFNFVDFIYRSLFEDDIRDTVASTLMWDFCQQNNDLLPINPIYNQIIANMNTNNFIHSMNPTEFLYQYSLGFLANDNQKKLIESILQTLITNKIAKKKLQGGNYKKYFIFTGEKELMSRKEPTIFNMPMGSGKTKMVTPIVVLRLMTYYLINKMPDNVYLVLPESLVEQSFNLMIRYIGNYHPINIYNTVETRSDREQFSDEIQTEPITFLYSINNISNSLCIISDTSVKSGLLNNPQKIYENRTNHTYLVDEVDTIVNPAIDDLNFPLDIKPTTIYPDYGFDILFSTLNTIYNTIYIKAKTSYSEAFDKIKTKYNKYWNEINEYFTIIDFNSEFLHDIREWFVDCCFKELMIFKNIAREKYYSYEFPVKMLMLNELVGEKELKILKSENDWLPYIYNIKVIVTELLTTILSMTDRKDFGLFVEKPGTPSKGLICPFASLEVPVVESQFSNPLTILSLTMISYINIGRVANIYNIEKIISKSTIEKIINSVLIDIQNENQDVIDEIKRLNINIFIKTFKIENITAEEILTVVKSPILMNNYIFDQLKTNIGFYKTIMTDNGIDVMSGSYFQNRVGYTGTPESIIPWIDPTGPLRILPVEQEERNQIDKAFSPAILQQIDISIPYDNPVVFLTEVLEKFIAKGCSVLIDVNGILLGINAFVLRKIFISRQQCVGDKCQFNRIVYWDDNHRGQELNLHTGIVSAWDERPGLDIFYFYDQQHITGIDAKIPLNATGIVIIDRNCIYRDFVQAVFRLRKLGNNQKLVSVLPTYLAETIDKSLGQTLNDKLRNWLILNEQALKEKYRQLMDKHELLHIFNYEQLNLIHSYNSDQSKFGSHDDDMSEQLLNNMFRLNNQFNYPKNFTDLNTNTSLYTKDIKYMADTIRSKYPMVADKAEKILNASGEMSKIQVQAQQKQQEKQQEQQIELERNKIVPLNYGNFVIRIENIQSYIAASSSKKNLILLEIPNFKLVLSFSAQIFISPYVFIVEQDKLPAGDYKYLIIVDTYYSMKPILQTANTLRSNNIFIFTSNFTLLYPSHKNDNSNDIINVLLAIKMLIYKHYQYSMSDFIKLFNISNIEILRSLFEFKGIQSTQKRFGYFKNFINTVSSQDFTKFITENGSRQINTTLLNNCNEFLTKISTDQLILAEKNPLVKTFRENAKANVDACFGLSKNKIKTKEEKASEHDKIFNDILAVKEWTDVTRLNSAGLILRYKLYEKPEIVSIINKHLFIPLYNMTPTDDVDIMKERLAAISESDTIFNSKLYKDYECDKYDINDLLVEIKKYGLSPIGNKSDICRKLINYQNKKGVVYESLMKIEEKLAEEKKIAEEKSNQEKKLAEEKKNTEKKQCGIRQSKALDNTGFCEIGVDENTKYCEPSQSGCKKKSTEKRTYELINKEISINQAQKKQILVEQKTVVEKKPVEQKPIVVEKKTVEQKPIVVEEKKPTDTIQCGIKTENARKVLKKELNSAYCEPGVSENTQYCQPSVSGCKKKSTEKRTYDKIYLEIAGLHKGGFSADTTRIERFLYNFAQFNKIGWNKIENMERTHPHFGRFEKNLYNLMNQYDGKFQLDNEIQQIVKTLSILKNKK